ncbi:hypothetical protein C8Q74DRAFT_926637 [Fomes fomentarius]|nr:hypothetical protein C8Q74DRAFT_926637 [Fomes fomentarius]
MNRLEGLLTHISHVKCKCKELTSRAYNAYVRQALRTELIGGQGQAPSTTVTRQEPPAQTSYLSPCPFLPYIKHACGALSFSSSSTPLRYNSPTTTLTNMVNTCTCQNNCGACGPSGTGCACAKDTCNCNDCPNNASAQSTCGWNHAQSGSAECACTRAGNKCTCAQ